MDQKLIFTNLVGQTIDDLVAEISPSSTVVITDTNTSECVLPVLRLDSKAVADAKQIIIESGEQNKCLENLKKVWEELSEQGATRTTLVINVGGGMITDLGGFAAATYKRGLKIINVPTTVLGAVDASVGGKTGINFNGYKNQLGTFTEPVAAVISTVFFNTMKTQDIMSGYAEMLKHGLLEDEATLSKLLKYSPVYPTFDSEAMMPLLQASVLVKEKVVRVDPTETGYRKVLNLGHTVGHALESFAMKHGSPIAHGYAVAWGIVAELILSNMKYGFPSETLHQLADYVKKNYGAFTVTCKDYPELIDTMRQDKKNDTTDDITFTLLKAVGDPVINVVVAPDDIKAALDIYRDLMGLA